MALIFDCRLCSFPEITPSPTYRQAEEGIRMARDGASAALQPVVVGLLLGTFGARARRGYRSPPRRRRWTAWWRGSRRPVPDAVAKRRGGTGRGLPTSGLAGSPCGSTYLRRSWTHRHASTCRSMRLTFYIQVATAISVASATPTSGPRKRS